ncbi:MAG: hypothetical protein JSV78_09030 [Phycisphaerales bacterium]|nr:MAG: hypothetical protein JSV78_09030 [Phycisphaerales bacterium]
MDGGCVIRAARLDGPVVFVDLSHHPGLQKAGDGAGTCSISSRLHDRYEVAA